MAIKDMLQSRALKRTFKESARRGEKELKLSFADIERIIGKKLPAPGKSKGAGDVFWNDLSEISGQWREFGYSVFKYDHKNGVIRFKHNDEVAEAHQEIKKAQEAVNKELFKEEAKDLSSKGLKYLIFYGILGAIVFSGLKSCADSLEEARMKREANDPCRKLGLESNWNNRECR